MVVALGVFVLYQAIITRIYPPQPPTTQPAPAEPTPTPAPGPESGPTGTAAATGPTTAAPPAYAFVASASLEPVILGGADGDALRVELDPRGASVARVQLWRKDKRGRFVYRAHPEGNAAYELLSPVWAEGVEWLSYTTARVWIKDPEPRSWDVGRIAWETVEAEPRRAVFRTALRSTDGDRTVLELVKSYTLRPNQPVIDLTLEVRNTAAQPLTVWVDQYGPLGIPQEGLQYDTRSLLSAQLNKTTVELNKAYQHAKLLDATLKKDPVRLTVPDKGPLVWLALTNKYFGAFTRPLPVDAPQVDYIAGVDGVAVDVTGRHKGDLLARLTTIPRTLAAGESLRVPLEIYTGAKDTDRLGKVNPAYADPAGLHYQLAQAPDTQSCCCQFAWLRELMIGLLGAIQSVVRNYGIAIIILVVIVRTLLHPLSVFQQKSMYRMQAAMSRLQPKMQAIKEKYANDKVRQNQEMMKLWAEEHVNPMSNFVAFIPLFLQMPILVALWSGLNTDINLRHAPFDGYWIRDLSAPDAILTFPPVTIPLLSWIMGDITSLNLLPLLMGVSMWLQQKYMPKPQFQKPAEPAAPPAGGQRTGGMTPEEQMRQQQIMAYVMAIVFPLMMYRLPSGLNLYWMATNIFGIGESLLIRRQLEREQSRPPAPTPREPRRPGLLGRFFQHIAAQAEELQRKADALRESEDGKKGRRKP